MKGNSNEKATWKELIQKGGKNVPAKKKKATLPFRDVIEKKRIGNGEKKRGAQQALLKIEVRFAKKSQKRKRKKAAGLKSGNKSYKGKGAYISGEVGGMLGGGGKGGISRGGKLKGRVGQSKKGDSRKEPQKNFVGWRV